MWNNQMHYFRLEITGVCVAVRSQSRIRMMNRDPRLPSPDAMNFAGERRERRIFLLMVIDQIMFGRDNRNVVLLQGVGKGLVQLGMEAEERDLRPVLVKKAPSLSKLLSDVAEERSIDDVFSRRRTHELDMRPDHAIEFRRVEPSVMIEHCNRVVRHDEISMALGHTFSFKEAGTIG
jgi:hypothetical protein